MNKRGKQFLNDSQLKEAFSEVTKFVDKYNDKVSGAFANRFGRAATKGNQPGSNPLPQDFTQAAGEIKTAEDILDGATPLGSDVKMRGLSEIGGQTNPDYLAVLPNADTRLVEVKTLEGTFDRKKINARFRKATEQIIGRVGAENIPITDKPTKLEGKSFEWQQNEPYDNFIENVSKAIREYAADISAIFINVDLFVYVYTEESPNKPVRAWVRRFGSSVEMGQFEICLDHSRNKEHYIYFDISHMLFYPDSWNYQEDNTELASLNQPLLEEALKKWEQKFDAEIDPDGLNGIYKYGYLPEDQW